QAAVRSRGRTPGSSVGAGWAVTAGRVCGVSLIIASKSIRGIWNIAAGCRVAILARGELRRGVVSSWETAPLAGFRFRLRGHRSPSVVQSADQRPLTELLADGFLYLDLRPVDRGHRGVAPYARNATRSPWNGPQDPGALRHHSSA